MTTARTRLRQTATWYNGVMTKLLEEAMAILEDLPENMQDTAARAIMDYAATVDEIELSDDQAAEVERRIADPDRAFLSLSETTDRLRHSEYEALGRRESVGRPGS